MSKSYGNGIFLREDMASIRGKVQKMVTNTARARKSDPGDPGDCNLFPYHELLSSPEECAEIRQGCTTASLGCVDCKKIFLRNLEAFLEPLHNRRTFLNNNPDYVHYVLTEGNKQARVAANKTMSLVRRKMGI